MGAAKGAFAFLLAACAVALVLLASKDWGMEKSEEKNSIQEALSLMNKRLEERSSDIDREAIEEFKRERLFDNSMRNYIAMEEDGFHLVDSQITKREILLEEHRRKKAVEILKELDYGDLELEFQESILVSAPDESAVFTWVDAPHEELIEPEFKWRNIPPEFEQGVASAANLYVSGITQTQDNLWLKSLDFPQGLKERAWTPENPILVGKSLNIDVSSFYDDFGNPVPTCIICLDRELILYASQSGKALMKGVAISSGGVQLLGVTFTGTVLSKNNAYIDASYLTPDPGMLFRIKFTSWNLQAMMLDAFTGSSLNSGVSGMGSLGGLAISEDSKIIFRPQAPLRLEMATNG
ncbi:MAG: hypothetical protein LBT59_29185 [Clostridiales bacterium]|nr:hypothetical protein [Clostridiales bacterium]